MEAPPTASVAAASGFSGGSGDARAEPQPQKNANESTGGGGGWGWGISLFSDLQKAADEISRNAVAVAKSAASSISDMELASNSASDASSKDADITEASDPQQVKEDEKDQIRKSALDKLESASEESLLGQGLKVFDTSMETLASGTWHALGTALKGGSFFVKKLEDSASSIADTIQQGNLPAKASTLAPSIIETGKSFTTRGIQVLEKMGKETLDMLIEQTGMEVENSGELEQPSEEDQFEEVSFERCFYIYGGPDQLEELEALSSHYSLLFNRRRTKLTSQQKVIFDGKLKEVQCMFDLTGVIDENELEAEKGKNIEAPTTDGDDEFKKLCESSIGKAASMAAGFASVLIGLAPNEVIQKTVDRLEAVHSEGVHRLSEMCCIAVSQLVVLGKSVISAANKLDNETEEHPLKIDWPEDSVSKAKIIRWKAEDMNGNVEQVSNSFTTGISDILEAYIAAMQNALSGKQENLLEQNQKSVEEKAKTVSEHLHNDQMSARSKIQEALHCLPYVVICTAIPTA